MKNPKIIIKTRTEIKPGFVMYEDGKTVRTALQGNVVAEVQLRGLRAYEVWLKQTAVEYQPNPKLNQIGMNLCSCGHIQNIERRECQNCGSFIVIGL